MTLHEAVMICRKRDNPFLAVDEDGMAWSFTHPPFYKSENREWHHNEGVIRPLSFISTPLAGYSSQWLINTGDIKI